MDYNKVVIYINSFECAYYYGKSAKTVLKYGKPPTYHQLSDNILGGLVKESKICQNKKVSITMNHSLTKQKSNILVTNDIMKDIAQEIYKSDSDSEKAEKEYMRIENLLDNIKNQNTREKFKIALELLTSIEKLTTGKIKNL